MLLGLWDPSRPSAALRQELSHALAKQPRLASAVAEAVWGEDGVAFAWAPRGIATLDEPGQPFHSRSGAITVMCEGKLHNAAELQQVLGLTRQEAAGSGTVLAELYERHSEQFLNPVNGTFAFALWDANARQLLLGRDRLGIESLYYSIAPQGGRIAFSTSLRSLVASGWVAPNLEDDALLRYLLFCYNPGDDTLVRGIRRVPAGHLLAVGASGATLRRYWRLSFAAMPMKTEAECCEAIPSLIDDAVRLRMEPDAPPGLFLSGGIDSSGIAVLASRRWLGHRLASFSFRCAGRSYDESEYARFMADYCRTDHTEIAYDASRLPLIATMAEHMDEPFSDIGIEIGTCLMGQAAQGRVSYVFSGEGGDELFGGHPVYSADKMAQVADRMPRLVRTSLIRALGRLPDTDEKKSLPVKLKRFAYSLAFPRELLSHRWRAYYTPQELATVCSPEWLARCDVGRALEPVLRYSREADGPDVLSRSLHSDFFTLVSFYLRRLELLRLWGIESRTPLLDYRLVEFAAAVPSRLKLRGLSDTKYVYKKALEGIVPNRILYERPKLGHSVPMKNWLRDAPAFRDWVRGILTDPSCVHRRWFRPGVIERWLEEHARRTHNHSHRLWALAVLELWVRSVEHA